MDSNMFYMCKQVVLLACLSVTIFVAREVQLTQINVELQSNGGVVKNEDEQKEGIFSAFKSFKNLPPGMPSVLLVTALTWLSWFPFILYDTDWMGREVYHGNPDGSRAEIDAYNRGVREGAFGLLLNSIVLGISSLMIEPMCRKLSARIVWVMSNFIMFVGMAATAIISTWSLHDFHGSIQDAVTVDGHVKAVALVLFAALGFPLAILYSVPFAVTAQLAKNEGGGQGLCTGVLNISIVVPQVIVALGAGPWDAVFKKGNIPAFALASAVAFVCGVVAFFLLPKLSKSNFRTSGVGGFH